MSIEIIPAIDLLDGACVRLLHGNFDAVTAYPDTPQRLAERYAEHGAEWLHVVDLEASRDGAAADTGPLLRLLEAAPQRVQTGGGVRAAEDVRVRLDAGADRVVVGSVAAAEPERFVRWLGEFGADRLVAALDVQIDANGVARPRVYGWTEEAGRTMDETLAPLVEAGLKHLLCTDIGRDGAMTGPNCGLYASLAGRYPSLAIQASGGISGLRDIKDLSDTGVAAAITGKALLEGCFTVAEALAVAR